MPLALTDLLSWSATCSLSGEYSGDASFTNQNLQYDDTLLWTPVSFRLHSTQTSSGISSASCFAGTSKWLAGVITSVNQVRELDKNMVDLKIVSYFAQYQQRVVNTQKFTALASAVLEEIFDAYLGIPSGIYLIALTTDLTITGIVSGNDAMDEVKKICQATSAVVFTQKTGTLTVENWKDNNSSIDVVIPPEAVISATLEKNTSKLPSRVMVRGRFISEYEAGEQIITSTKENPTAPNTQKPAEEHGNHQRCIYNGLGMAHMGVTLANLDASKEDLDNAAVKLVEPCFEDSSGDALRQKTGGAFRKTNVKGKGKVEVDIEEACGGYLEADTRTWKFLLSGRRKKTFEFDDPTTKNRHANQNKNSFEKKMRKAFSKIGKTSSNNTAFFGAGGEKNDDRAADEKSQTRIEMSVYDPDLVAEFGIVDAQIDNLYISSYEQLFQVGIRHLQEGKMSRVTWQVETVYLACLSVNDVVTFTTPAGEEVTGLLTDINLSYEQGEDTVESKMTLSIQSFEELGSTVYTSGNLITYPEMLAVNGQDWVGNDGVRMMNGYAAFTSFGQLYQTLLTTSGHTYTVTLQAFFQSGGQLSVTMGSGSLLLSSSGNYTFSFVASSALSTLYFSSSGNWFVRFVQVTKSVTA